MTTSDPRTHGSLPDRVLTVLTGTTTSSLPLADGARLTIGRSRDNDVFIDDPSVSRHHAVLYSGPPLYVEDLGSANGTRIRDGSGAAHADGAESVATTPHNDLVVAPGRRVEVAAGSLIRVGSVVLVVEAHGLEAAGAERAEGRAFVARDPAVLHLLAMIDRIADSTLSVLILGETGVGKELFAERIVERSARKNRPFVRLNCSALSPTLLESELFGHERGAFTGATQSRIGLLEAAHGGTVFLDEVGDLPPPLQSKLLRVLEDGQVLPVGATRPRPVDVRFVSATNRDLECDIPSGAFRQDLYFRLSGTSLVIPPLRSRRVEIEPLALAFAEEASARAGRPSPSLLGPTLEILVRHSWPGNVRELRNVMERAVLLAAGHPISPEHLPLERMGSEGPPSLITMVPPPTQRSPALGLGPASIDELKSELEQRERERIEHALAQCGGNQTRAAALLGISRGTMLARIEAFGLKRPRKRSP